MIFKTRHLVMFLFLFTGCSKQSPLTEIKLLLAGSSGGHKTWQLSSLIIDGQSQKLEPAQLTYKKTYYFDGTYSDSDALEGVWRLDSETELLEVYDNLSTGLLFQEYDEVIISSKSLSLHYLLNGEHVTATYTAVK